MLINLYKKNFFYGTIGIGTFGNLPLLTIKAKKCFESYLPNNNKDKLIESLDRENQSLKIRIN